MKERILNGWTVVRFIYLVLGIGLIIQAVTEHQWIGAGLGTYFASMAVFNYGCASGACINLPAGKPVQNSDINTGNPGFEEIKEIK